MHTPEPSPTETPSEASLAMSAGAMQRSGSARLYHLLFDEQAPAGLAGPVNRLLIGLIVLSSLALVLEFNPVIARDFAPELAWLDTLLVLLFSLEYLLRWFTASAAPAGAGRRWPRLRWMFSRYALIDLVAIAPFYLALFLPVQADWLRLLRLARLMRILKLGRHLGAAWREFIHLNRHRHWRGRLYALLEPTGHSGALHRYLDNFIVFWVLVAILNAVLESVESLHRVFALEMALIDTVAFSIFALEYAARWLAAPENPAWRHRRLPRLAFMRSPQAIIDLLAILPFLLERFLPWPLDLRFLRVFRLLRLLKLTRYTSATGTLYKVVRREGQVIFAAVFVMILLVVLTASIGYLFEHAAQPDKFENIPQSIYWAVVTLASVGYGDISPVTPMGRALTVVLSLLGIGIFAIPAGLLASAFTDQLRMDREALKHKLLAALEHGQLDPKAREWLSAETERLHLSPDDVKRLMDEARESLQARQRAEQASAPVHLIDPAQHPELALAQIRLLVQQLQLLHQTAGAQALENALPAASLREEDALLRAVLQALRETPRAAKP